MIGQFIPAPTNRAMFVQNRDELFAELGHYLNDMAWQSDQFNPYPFLVSQQQCQSLHELGRAIAAGIRAVVANYLEDERLSARIPLDHPFVEILRWAEPQDYRIGCFRPDFVIDEAGEVRVCEINARFSANGFHVSHCVDAALRNTSYLGSPCTRPHNIYGIQAIRASLTAEWQAVTTLALVTTQEAATEMVGLLGQIPYQRIHPSQLRPRAFDRVILEMDRKDLLLLPKPTLRWLWENDVARNNLSTNILVHDKRLLSVLCDPELMGSYLSQAQAALLAKHIIPTYSADHPGARAEAWAHPQDWVLKPASGGRGVDTHVGTQTGLSEWRAILSEHSADFVVQPYVRQKSWPIACLEQGQFKTSLMNVVGLLPCFNDEVFGPGIFRAGTAAVINVHQQRGEILPCALGLAS